MGDMHKLLCKHCAILYEGFKYPRILVSRGLESIEWGTKIHLYPSYNKRDSNRHVSSKRSIHYMRKLLDLLPWDRWEGKIWGKAEGWTCLGYAQLISRNRSEVQSAWWQMQAGGSYEDGNLWNVIAITSQWNKMFSAERKWGRRFWKMVKIEVKNRILEDLVWKMMYAQEVKLW